MLSIPCPENPGEETYREQATHTRNRNLRQALLAECANVGARTTEYLRSAQIEELYTLRPQNFGEIAPEMANVYGRVLVRGSGRPLYNKIKGRAKFARCPFCGQRDVKTIDHYLPKQQFPEFSVFPANLVPCCSDCNKTKGEYLAARHEDQLLHPYFDDWTMHRLLKADVFVGDKVDVTFEVLPAPGVPPELLARAHKHFAVLELGPLYATGAAVELVENKDNFRRNFQMGADALREELLYIAESRQRGNLNSWRAALYRGLAGSDAFCEGGFELIEE